jgi:hypothetical protein
VEKHAGIERNWEKREENAWILKKSTLKKLN